VQHTDVVCSSFAQCNHVIESDSSKGSQVFGMVCRNVDAGLGHHGHRKRIHAVCLDSGRKSFDPVVAKRVDPTLGDLAAAGVSAANKQNAFFVKWVTFVHQIPSPFPKTLTSS